MTKVGYKFPLRLPVTFTCKNHDQINIIMVLICAAATRLCIGILFRSHNKNKIMEEQIIRNDWVCLEISRFFFFFVFFFKDTEPKCQAKDLWGMITNDWCIN